MFVESRCKICKSKFRGLIEDLYFKQKWTLREISEYSKLQLGEGFSHVSLHNHVRLHTEQVKLPEQIIIQPTDRVLKSGEIQDITIHCFLPLTIDQLNSLQQIEDQKPLEGIVTRNSLYDHLSRLVETIIPSYIDTFKERYNDYFVKHDLESKSKHEYP